MTISTYVNPFTDFGFKRLFGEEANKGLLLDFLNELLPLDSPIEELTFKSPEQMGDTEKDRRAVYDIYCQSFNKTEDELLTRKDKWIYFLKNLEDFNEIPAILNEPIFQEAFDVARVANFDDIQLDAYEESLRNYRDLHNVVVSAVDKRVKEIIIRNLKRGKLSVEEIAEDNDVPIALITAIQKEIKRGLHS